MTSRNALLLFSKPPLAGMVKTRLTKGRGGVLTEGEAAELYRRCLLDITDLSMLSLADLEYENQVERSTDQSKPKRTYDYIISTTPEESVSMMRALFEGEGDWGRPIQYFCDKGASFDEHFNDAFTQLFNDGYDNVVAIGGDHPTITREHITEAFKWLDCFSRIGSGAGFVQAPCQESGVSLVGKTKATPPFDDDIFYNEMGRPAIDGYIEMLRKFDIPNAFLHSISDIDSDVDLAHAISCINAMAEASRYQTGLFVPLRVLEWMDQIGLQASSPPNENRDPRELIDIKK